MWHIDVQIEALNEALQNWDIETYNALKEQWGFQEMFEIEQDKTESFNSLTI